MAIKGKFLESYMRLLIIGNQNIKFLEVCETPCSYRTGAYLCDFFFFKYEDLFLAFSLQIPPPVIHMLSPDLLEMFNTQISIS